MAVNVNEVKEAVETIVRKDQKTTYLSATQFNRYAKLAQLDVINQQRLLFESGTISSDNLHTLKTKTQYNIDYTTGQLTKPSDYLYYVDTIFTKFTVNKRGTEFASKDSVDFVSSGQLGERLDSEFRKVSKGSPIVVEYDTVLQYYPINIGVVELVYIKDPVIPFWNYTVTSNVQTYKESSGGALTNPNDGGTGSTNFDLPVQLKNDLILKICEYFGVSVRQQDLVQSATFLKANQ